MLSHVIKFKPLQYWWENLKKIKTGIVGASGYTGLELIQILLKHPHFEITYLATSEGGITASELHRSLTNLINIPISKADTDEVAENCELIFLALPHKTAMEFVQKLMKFPNLKIVDLSADYRLKLETYEKFYTKHTDSENLQNAVYGLPEFYRNEISKSRLVANPGCYPTSAILGLKPFLQFRKSETPIFIDSKSGVSGAGKKLSETTHFVNVNENIFSYNPLGHRHSPEIAEKCEVSQNRIHFVPHLIPVTRGMLSSIYLQVSGDFDPLEVLREFYKNEPFIRIFNSPPKIYESVKTNFCDIFAKRDGDILYISSAIDNLSRGASSQAVVNANIMFGLDETVGIL
jgi:N-acetyl-gamma-glutamyl-phosphate reductase